MDKHYITNLAFCEDLRNPRIFNGIPCSTKGYVLNKNK